MAKFLFVIAHPEPKSFNHALVAEAAARRQGNRILRSAGEVAGVTQA
jgi:putative NADPH-quinone reductase